MVSNDGTAERLLLVRTFYDALDAGDYDRLRSVLSSSFVHDRPDRRLTGREAFVTFMRDERPNTDTRHERETLFEATKSFAVQGRLLDAEGDPLLGFVDIHSFEANEITHVRTYVDRDLAAVDPSLMDSASR